MSLREFNKLNAYEMIEIYNDDNCILPSSHRNNAGRIVCAGELVQTDAFDYYLQIKGTKDHIDLEFCKVINLTAEDYNAYCFDKL